MINDTQSFARANYPNVNNLQGHKVYAKVSTLRESTNVIPGIYTIFGSGPGMWDVPQGEAVSWIASSSNARQWFDVSTYTEYAPYNYLRIMLAQSLGTGSKGGIIHFDGLVVIDLTATFGSGNEPDKEWCDRHINYFDGTTIIYK